MIFSLLLLFLYITFSVQLGNRDAIGKSPKCTVHATKLFISCGKCYHSDLLLIILR